MSLAIVFSRALQGIAAPLIRVEHIVRVGDSRRHRCEAERLADVVTPQKAFELFAINRCVNRHEISPMESMRSDMVAAAAVL